MASRAAGRGHVFIGGPVNAPFKPLWQSALPFAAGVVVVGAFAACSSNELPIGTDQPVTCATNTDCPQGDACGTAHVCGMSCLSSADCPPNELCEGGACTKPGGSSSSSSGGTGCLSSADCPPNETCVSGVCTAPAGLQWYDTCGDPVCHGHTTQPFPACSTQMAGQPCTLAGVKCDPGDSCNRLLECASSNPATMCPVSRARFKHDIRYLPDADLARVKDDLMTMRLSTWRYNNEGQAGREHLGFIIDDNPESPSVDASGDHVDLYGYTSMAVAAVQVQDKEIAAQRQKIESLERAIEALKNEVRTCKSTSR
jgi:hypothetical protein